MWSRLMGMLALPNRGRTAGYPAAPAQISACGFPAPSSSVALASALGSGPRICLPWSAAFNDSRFDQFVGLEHLRIGFPVIALLLTSPLSHLNRIRLA